MKLTSEKLDEIRVDCMFKNKDEIDPNAPAIRVDGPIHSVILLASGLEKHHEEIHEMLLELPDSYRQGYGGGSSLIEAFHDRHGNVWAPHIMYIEELILIGIASGWMKELYFGVPTRGNPDNHICHYMITTERINIQPLRFEELQVSENDPFYVDAGDDAEDDDVPTFNATGGMGS